MTVVIILGVIMIAWTIATYFVEQEGPEKTWVIGSNDFDKTALIVYDPDPIYNLDEQIAHSFAEGLSSDKWQVEIRTISSLGYKAKNDKDLLVLVANTYNFRPDKAISTFILKHPKLEDQATVAITLGSGATGRSQRIHEENIKKKGAVLIGSKSYWLMKPNDDSRTRESNVDVAKEMARAFALDISKLFSKKYTVER